MFKDQDKNVIPFLLFVNSALTLIHLARSSSCCFHKQHFLTFNKLQQAINISLINFKTIISDEHFYPSSTFHVLFAPFLVRTCHFYYQLKLYNSLLSLQNVITLFFPYCKEISFLTAKKYRRHSVSASSSSALIGHNTCRVWNQVM